MDKILSVRSAAEYLEFTEQTIRRYIRSKKIPFHKMGRVIRFIPAELDEWVKNDMKMDSFKKKENQG